MRASHLLHLTIINSFRGTMYQHWAPLNDVSTISKVKYEQMGQVFKDTKVLGASYS
jgi:hypothetical protein